MRGSNRQRVFKDEEDNLRFLETINTYQENSEYQVYAYCLMSNHVHLLMKKGIENLGIVFRRIGASYVCWYNWS
ncbi:MAG TPA: hypothetical protein GX693_00905 [Firmicutes bacterium]|nr:hypothetical protein [Bacillota bacterium]